MKKIFFEKLFLDLINNKKNRFHPLVWINGNPQIGKNVYIGGFSEVNAKRVKISIGDNCDISSFVSINSMDSHKKTIGKSNKIIQKDIKIGKNVFIGSHSFIGGGSIIGDYSVIGAGSVVRGEKIPSYSLAFGNPLKIKKNYYRIKN